VHYFCGCHIHFELEEKTGPSLRVGSFYIDRAVCRQSKRLDCQNEGPVVTEIVNHPLCFKPDGPGSKSDSRQPYLHYVEQVVVLNMDVLN